MDNEKVECQVCHHPGKTVSRREDGVWKCHHDDCGASGNGQPVAKPKKTLGPIVKTYDYTDESGEFLFQVTRHDPKDFRQRHWAADGSWVNNIKGVRRVLYGLPSLIEAVASGWTIYVVEGEKDADAINGLDSGGEFFATTAPMGASYKWLPEFTPFLAGADVVIVADGDEPGRKRALDVQFHLKDACKSVKIVTAKEGKDAFDHLEAGFGLGDFVPLESASVVVQIGEPQGEAVETIVVDLPESCWRHGFDVFREACNGSTEAADAYIWGAYLSAASCVLGRQATLDCGFDVYPNVFVVSVGASGRARKTTAQAYFRGLLRHLDESVIHSSGVGSPEGLIEMLSGKGEGVSQRCVLDLNELSSLLLKASSEATRGLGPLLTTLYDCPETARLPNRKSNLIATEPYLCVISSTTRDWLQRDLSTANVAGGLANRFIYLWGPEKPAIPFPPKRDARLLADCEAILRSAMNRHSMLVEYGLTGAALEIWSPWYINERGRKYDSPVAEALAQRLHITALKVAMIFAAVEGTAKIEADQIESAIDFANYQRDVQRIAFEGYGQSSRQRVEDRVRSILKEFGPLPAWRIVQLCRSFSAYEIKQALKDLTDAGVLADKDGRRTPLYSLGHE